MNRKTILAYAYLGLALVFFVALILSARTCHDQAQFADAVAPARQAAQEPSPFNLPTEVPTPPNPGPAAAMVATFYGEDYRGLIMANGQPFDPDKFTCAHRTLAIGTPLEITYNGRQIAEIPVTDRGPWDKFPPGHPRAGEYRKDLDLSEAAFRYLSPDMTGGEGLRVYVRKAKK